MSAPNMVEKRLTHGGEPREVPVFGYSVTVQTYFPGEDTGKPMNLLWIKSVDGTSARVYLSNAEAFALAHELMRGVRPQ